jgi:hypothetical protein
MKRYAPVPASQQQRKVSLSRRIVLGAELNQPGQEGQRIAAAELVAEGLVAEVP